MSTPTTEESLRSDPLGAARPPALPRSVIDELWRVDLDDSALEGRDPAFIEGFGRPICNWLSHTYFRAEYEGEEHVPEEPPFIAVGTHSGAPLLPDVWPLLAKYWDLFSPEQPAYALVHDAAFRVPFLRNVLIKLGALRASWDNAEKVLDGGGVVLVFPGGDVEAMRSFRRRNRVDLRGRTGVARLALRNGVPVLPFVNVGGHEAYVVLTAGRRLARWTGLSRLTRVEALPIIAGLPWGIWPSGFLPYVPLPTKINYKAGPAMDFPHAPWLADNEDAVHRASRELQDRMQALVGELEERRRLPVLG